MASNKPHVSLICIGSELLRGKINTHSSTLARRLASIGLELHEEHTVSDRQEEIAQAVRRALQSNAVVIATGGLGPTFDDLTREAAGDATGRPLIFSKELLRGIQAKFRLARYRKMPPTNQRQAYLLEGARPLANAVGTAPGQWLDIRGHILILLPGPPSELSPMLEKYVLPQLKKAFPVPPRSEAHLHFVGLPESMVDHRVRPIIEKAPDADFTILAHLGLVDLDIFVSAPTKKRADRTLAKLVRAVRAEVGRAFYGLNADYPLEKVVMDLFLSKRVTLAVAESCTGGMLSKKLTDIPGSSKYFKGGVISYSNAVKMEALGVPAEILKKYGAVSPETASSMARGVREKLGSTWGLSITGIAGPDGGTSQKPVGLVHLGLAGPRGVLTEELHLRGSRDAIRTRAVISALDLLRLIGTVDRS